ncbi:hypothetical protein [Zavarzinella formosa]|uniref:hypothetical protein n=1 Tax=Zavarzinella formosa TaxID=360055 RepID=UPI0003123AA6|nr:hypothetical protein [Zavarzinella formosa]
MSFTGTFQSNANVEGRTYNASTTILSDNMAVSEKSVAGAKTGTLTTRTDANTGTLTMDAGHGITTGARLDLYWATGSRLGMTVGTVSVNSVPIDLGSGDDLPVASPPTAITAKVPEVEELLVTGDNVQSISVYSAVRGKIVIAESGADALAKELPGTGGWNWFTGNGQSNPLAGKAVAKVLFSHGETTPKTMRIAIQH